MNKYYEQLLKVCEQIVDPQHITNAEDISFQKAVAAASTFKWILEQFENGVNFHPDTPFGDYVDRNGKPSFNGARCARLNGELYDLFNLCNTVKLDIYEISIDAFEAFSKRGAR